jgi:hypothetical protein
MEKVVYLEADEEITSIVDRFKQIEEGKIALVVPKRANVLQSIVNLKLLKRQIENLNKEVVIVTTDRLGRNLASQVGFIVYQKVGEKPIEVESKPLQKPTETEVGYRKTDSVPRKEPVFSSAPSIADITYRKEEKKESPEVTSDKIPEMVQKPIQEKPKIIHKSASVKEHKISKKKGISDNSKKAILIGGIVFVILAVLVCFIILPKAKVSLVLKGTVTQQNFAATIDQAAKSPNFDKAILPGSILSSTKDQTNKSLPCTGKKNIGQKASGSVTISNAFDENPQSLVANTRLVSTTNNKTYRLTSAVTVPGAKVSGGNIVPGTIDASVQAEEPGETYNIANSHFNIPGLAGSAKFDKIYADTTGIKGGFTEEVTVLSQTDLDTNKDKIIADLTKKISDELVAKNKNKKVFLDGIKQEVIEVSPNIPVDTESQKFDLKVKIKITTMNANSNDFNYLVYTRLSTSLSPDKEMVQESSEVTKAIVENFDGKKGIETVKIDGKGFIVTKLDQDNIKKSIAGKGESEASRYLSTLKDVIEVKVDLWPFWVKSVPRFLNRNIDITTQIQK